MTPTEVIAQELRTQRPWGGDPLSEEESMRIAERLLKLIQTDDGQGALVERVWIWFADNGNIRKWQTTPFEEGAEYVLAAGASGPCLATPPSPEPDAELVRALEEIRDYPETYNDGTTSHGIGYAFHHIQAVARNALRRHRKQGGE